MGRRAGGGGGGGGSPKWLVPEYLTKEEFYCDIGEPS
jgi:hypothetical protein